MLKPAFLNILLYLFVKYLVFYVYLMFKNNDYYFLEPGIRDGADLFYYLWLLLFLPFTSILLFSAPIYYSFKLNRAIYFMVLISGVLVAEYFLYTHLASQADLMNGVYNGILSVLFLFLFFFKHIRFIFKQGINNSKAAQ
jgi:hypothetical protein